MKTNTRSRRIGRRWHRWGRLHWYMGNATGPLGWYGFTYRRGALTSKGPAQLCLGPLFLTWWRR